MKSSKHGSAHGFYSARFRSASLALLLIFAAPVWADLASVKAEANPERRSERALDYANQALTTARQQYQDGHMEQFQESVRDVETAAEICLQSLEGTGKSARKNPKYFKRAELNTRTLLRRIENLRQEVSVDDRETVGQLKNKIDAIHDKLVEDLMEKKK